MTTQDLQAIREAAAANSDSIIVIIIPPGHESTLFGESTSAPRREEKDFNVAQYRAHVEPDLSESRIREMCGEDVFPDTIDEAGEVVPGAYKDSAGNWRITREGVVARQKKEREEGLRKRAEAKAAKAHDDAVTAADEANERHVQTREKTRRPRSGAAKGSSGRNKRVARPNRGNWKNQF